MDDGYKDPLSVPRVIAAGILFAIVIVMIVYPILKYYYW